jgi:hypothetical protein
MSRADRARPLRPPALLSFSVSALVARLSERFSPFRCFVSDKRQGKDGGEQKEQNKKEQSRSSKRRGNPLLISFCLFVSGHPDKRPCFYLFFMGEPLPPTPCNPLSF